MLDLIKKVVQHVTNPGAAIEKALDAVLPKELEWMGDIASLATNIKAGRWHAALGDIADLQENIKNGDFVPEKLLAGLKKLLPPGCEALLDRIIHPDPPQARCGHSPSSPPPSVSGCGGGSTSQVSSSGGGSSSSQVSSSGTGSASAPKSVADFDKLSDKEFMEKMRKGDIPDDIKKDPAAMRALQQRMHDIAEMNALLTAIMRLLHDMQMAIIQNIRA